MKPFLKWLAITFLVLILLIVSCVGILLFSPSGINIVLWGVQQAFPSVRVEKIQGQLLDGLLLEGIDAQIASIDIKAKSIFVDLSTDCLLAKKVCVDAFEVDGMRVLVKELAPSEKTPSEPLTEISAPLPIQIANVKLTDVFIDAMGYQFSSSSLTTAAEWKGDTAILKPTLWQDIAIYLPKSEVKTSAQTAEVTASEKLNNIELPKITLPLKLVVEDIQLSNLKLNDELILAKLKLQAQAAKSEISLKEIFVDAPQGELKATADIDLQGNYPLSLEADLHVKQAPLEEHVLNLKAQGELNKLAINADLAGVLKATVLGQVNALDMNFPFDISVTSSNLQWPIQKPEYQLVNTEIKGQGNINAYQASIKTALKGKAVPEVKLATQLTGNLSEAALNQIKINTLGGVISGNASAGWKEDVSWQTAFDFKSIQPGVFWKEAEGQVSGDFAQNGKFSVEKGWEIDVSKLDIQGIIRKQALTVKGKLQASGNPETQALLVKTPGLALHHGKNSLVLKGAIDEKIALDLNLNFPSISSSLPKMKGQASGNIALSGSIEKPQAKLNLSAKDLVVQKNVLAIKNAKIQGFVNVSSMITGDIQLDIQNIKAEGLDLKKVALKASGTEKNHSLTLSATGEPVSTDIKLSGSVANQVWKGSIDKADLETPLGKWLLNKKTQLEFNAQKTALNLDSFCLKRNESKICIDEVQTQQEKGKARLTIQEFKLANLNKFLPEGSKVRGRLNGKTDVEWQPKLLPKVKLDFVVSKGRVSQRLNEAEPPFAININKISLSALVDKNKLDSRLTLDLAENGSAVFDLDMDKLASDNRTVNSQFSANKISLGILAPALEQNAKLAGILDGSLSLTGNLKAPKANGKLSLSGLKLQSLDSPVVISDGGILISLNGQKGNVSGEIDTPDGQLLLKGEADWQKIDAWLAQLNVSSKKLKVEIPPMIDMVVAPDLVMKASPKLIEVTGKASVPWGRIKLEQLPASAVTLSNDMIILNDKRQPISTKKTSGLPFNADLVVELGEDVRLEAFGLKTNLTGNLNVESSAKATMILGEISLEEGTYRSFGQDLKISSGSIRFSGPADQPYMQVTAIRNPDAIEDGVEAGIRVVGTPDSPNVEIFSVPAMPQAHALSYLTRGRGLDSEAGGDAVTSMLIGLGLSQSGMLVGRIGEAFGVKDLSVDTAGQGDDEQVVVSGYILPGLQVKYGVGIFTSVPEFTLRYNLLKSLYLEAVSGADTAVDLLYQFSIQ